MISRTRITLVDDDGLRRARISSSCARAGVHVEPYDSPEELAAGATGSTVLVHDREGWIEGVAAAFGQHGRSCAIVAFADTAAPKRVVDALFAGALDFLQWPFTPDDIGAALDRIAVRGARAIERRERAARAEARLGKLSQRERDVIERMAEGLTNKDIGRVLQISPRTVEIHRANAMGKLGVENSAAAIRLSLEASDQAH